MANVFDTLRAQPVQPEAEPEPQVSESSSSAAPNVMQSWAARRQLTPTAKAGQRGYTHQGLGECPVCGRVGSKVVLPNDITVAFCQNHNVSLPVPPTFFD